MGLGWVRRLGMVGEWLVCAVVWESLRVGYCAFEASLVHFLVLLEARLSSILTLLSSVVLFCLCDT